MASSSVPKMQLLSREPLLRGPRDASDIESLSQGKATIVTLRRLLKTVFGEEQGQESSAHPLKDVAPRQVLAILRKDEEDGHFEVEELEKDGQGDLLEQLARAASGESAAHRGAVVHAESLEDRGFEDLSGADLVVKKLGCNVISLLLNDNGLQKVEVHSPGLRSLVLSGNPLGNGAALENLPLLLHLDLSFTSVGALVQDGTLKIPPNLMSLSLECVDLEGIADKFFDGSKITVLSLADNEELEDISAVNALANSLEDLDLRETPVEKKKQRAAMIKTFPRLTQLNGAATKVVGLNQLKVEGSLVVRSEIEINTIRINATP